MKIGFVILCYKNPNVVYECVQKLLALYNIETCEIILVDNNSPDNTGNLLLNKYKDSKNVTVIINNDNIGFAKGNNVGYRFAREDRKCEIIIVMNSDIFIEDKLFLEKIEAYANDFSDIAIVAPDIKNLKNEHTNPLMLGYLTIESSRKSIFRCMLKNILIKANIHLNTRHKKNNSMVEMQEDDIFIPHGACLIYLKTWTANETLAFCPATFLFFEECFLERYCYARNYKIVYCDLLEVIHAENASIDASRGIGKEKAIFVNKQHILSLKKYIRFMHNPILYWDKE